MILHRLGTEWVRWPSWLQVLWDMRSTNHRIEHYEFAQLLRQHMLCQDYTTVCSGLFYTKIWTSTVGYLLETSLWSRRSHDSWKTELQHSSSFNGPPRQYTLLYLFCTRILAQWDSSIYPAGSEMRMQGRVPRATFQLPCSFTLPFHECHFTNALFHMWIRNLQLKISRIWVIPDNKMKQYLHGYWDQDYDTDFKDWFSEASTGEAGGNDQ